MDKLIKQLIFQTWSLDRIDVNIILNELLAKCENVVNLVSLLQKINVKYNLVM